MFVASLHSSFLHSLIFSLTSAFLRAFTDLLFKFKGFHQSIPTSSSPSTISLAFPHLLPSLTLLPFPHITLLPPPHSLFSHLTPLSTLFPFPHLTPLPPSHSPSPIPLSFPHLTLLPPSHYPSPISFPFPHLILLPPSHSPFPTSLSFFPSSLSSFHTSLPFPHLTPLIGTTSLSTHQCCEPDLEPAGADLFCSEQGAGLYKELAPEHTKISKISAPVSK